MTTWRKSSYSGSQTNCVEVGIAPWHRSSHSGAQTQCVEVATAPWRKSSYSGSQGDCVEVAGDGRVVVVRDTQDRSGAVLGFRAGAWHAFAADLKRR